VDGLTLSTSNPIWLPAIVLEMYYNVINSAVGGSILTKFGISVQNDTPMTKINYIKMQKSRAKFQMAAVCFPENKNRISPKL